MTAAISFEGVSPTLNLLELMSATPSFTVRDLHGMGLGKERTRSVADGNP